MWKNPSDHSVVVAIGSQRSWPLKMGAQNLVVEKKREMGAQIFTVGEKREAEEQYSGEGPAVRAVDLDLGLLPLVSGHLALTAGLPLHI